MIDFLNYKKIVTDYLHNLVVEDFDLFFDFSTEIIFTENIISKKIIAVRNFSEIIEDNTELKKYLSIVISNINSQTISIDEMKKNVFST